MLLARQASTATPAPPRPVRVDVAIPSAQRGGQKRQTVEAAPRRHRMRSKTQDLAPKDKKVAKAKTDKGVKAKLKVVKAKFQRKVAQAKKDKGTLPDDIVKATKNKGTLPEKNKGTMPDDIVKAKKDKGALPGDNVKSKKDDIVLPLTVAHRSQSEKRRGESYLLMDRSVAPRPRYIAGQSCSISENYKQNVLDLKRKIENGDITSVALAKSWLLEHA